jgi:hypothetical protein
MVNLKALSPARLGRKGRTTRYGLETSGTLMGTSFIV